MAGLAAVVKMTSRAPTAATMNAAARSSLILEVSAWLTCRDKIFRDRIPTVDDEPPDRQAALLVVAEIVHPRYSSPAVQAVDVIANLLCRCSRTEVA